MHKAFGNLEKEMEGMMNQLITPFNFLQAFMNPEAFLSNDVFQNQNVPPQDGNSQFNQNEAYNQNFNRQNHQHGNHESQQRAGYQG